jgi:general secretion pathway protein C
MADISGALGSWGREIGPSMRLRTHPRAERLFRRLPRFTALSALELLLLALIAVQGARLVWTLITPVGPVGAWRTPGTLALAGDSALSDFDPFFRLSAAGGPAVVTSLNLKLYGVREDRATGRGSAIIALPDGSQSSFAVGDEIMPGVRLAAVGFDHVTIDRGGAAEQIFLDQSEAPPGAGAPPTGPAAPAAAPTPGQAAPPAAPASTSGAIRLQPRIGDGQVDGLVVSPGADGGQAFRAAGFVPGDVIVSVNGQRVTSTEQARAIIRNAGGAVQVIVNRGGRAVPMRVRLDP